MKDKIEKILMEELDYAEFAAKVTALDLMNLQPQLRDALYLWAKDRTETNIWVEGYSTFNLMASKGFTYPAALIALDWLITETEIAKMELSKDTFR